MKESHVFDPKHVAVLESEDRKTWQNPEKILELIELKPDYVVADLGCGSGFFTVPLSRKVKKVYGIDVQKEMLEFLEQKIQTQKIGNIETMLSGEEEIPLENECVDLLLSVNTLHEFRDKRKMISEMRRVLRQEGQAVIIDFKKEETPVGPPVAIRVSKEQAVGLFKKQGLTFLKAHDLKYHYLIVFQKELDVFYLEIGLHSLSFRYISAGVK
jgi:ubiquinone/menaquinone biosynthesis C-methylase UbiE